MTDREIAKSLKSNCEGLKRAGIEPNMSDLRYIKLAEYENAAEHIEMTTNAPALSYQVAMVRQIMDGVKRFMDGKADKPTKTIVAKTLFDETSVYKLDEEPKDETKWAKDNPTLNVDGKSINDMIMRRFMERR